MLNIIKTMIGVMDTYRRRLQGLCRQDCSYRVSATPPPLAPATGRVGNAVDRRPPRSPSPACSAPPSESLGMPRT